MNENIYYTYAWLREDGTPYYIGKGKGNRAWKSRKGRAVPPKERVLILKKNLSEEEAFIHEVYMINVFGRKDKGEGILHNFTDGGEGVSGHIHSEETKERMRGRVVSEEVRQVLSEKCSGWKHSEKAKEKIRQYNLENPPNSNGHRPESIEKMRLAKSGANNPHYGKPRPEEVKRKIREAKRRRYKCLETGYVSSASQLTKYQRKLGIDVSKRIEVKHETDS